MGQFGVEGGLVQCWGDFGSKLQDPEPCTYRGVQQPHAGCDVVCEPLSAVFAPADGRVRSQTAGTQGRHQLLEFPKHWVYILHLNDYAGVVTGQVIKKGQKIGRSGLRDLFVRINGMPPHVHVQTWRKSAQPTPPVLPLSMDGKCINPFTAYDEITATPQDIRVGDTVRNWTDCHLRNGPDGGSLGVVPLGNLFDVLEVGRDSSGAVWLRVRRHSNGAVGWVGKFVVREV